METFPKSFRFVFDSNAMENQPRISIQTTIRKVNKNENYR